MIKFLLKGLLRDKSRSFFPILVVIAGVAITVLAYSWISGYQEELIRTNAKFNTGHVKIITQAYAEQGNQIANDLALLGVDSLINSLEKEYPDMLWTPRINFGGLLDIPDEQGETRDQGPVIGMALNLIGKDSFEKKLLNLQTALVQGRLPDNPGEILISDEFAQKLNVKPGDVATLISSTMYGGMAMYNFTIAGTVRFGVSAMDRSAIIADIQDVRVALDMQNAAGEILGFTKNFLYVQKKVDTIKSKFNSKYQNSNDEFSPTMLTLREQNGVGEMLDMVNGFSGVLVGIFIVAMSIVLWNAGLMGSLRRYGEIGVRLAIGEHKSHIFGSMIGESIIIGTFGSILGTMVGLAVSYYMQIKGFDMSSFMQESSMYLSDVMRAKVTPVSYFIGFIPGLLATIFGTSIAGIGIYKRQTSQLFKELEV